MPTPTTVDLLLDRYDGLLLDASGVLYDESGPLPGAAALVARLRREERPWLVVSNSSARTPEHAAAHFRRLGIEVPDDRVLLSASLLPAYFEERDLAGRPCVVLGPPDSVEMARRAGAALVQAGDDAAVVVIGDEAGYDFVPTVDRVLTALVHRLDRGDDVALVVPNPDRSYPKGGGALGFTSGAIADLVEGVLADRYGLDAPRFVPLGKPTPRPFEAACARLGTRELCMVGDQIATDVKGALAAGLDAALIFTGLADEAAVERSPVQPTWLLESLATGFGG